MSFYYSLYTAILALSAVLGKNKKAYLTACFLLLGVTAAIRGEYVGTDTAAYYRIFRLIANGTDDGNIESAFWLLNKIIAFLGFHEEILILLVSFFSIGITLWYFGEHSRSCCLSVIIYTGFCYYFLSYNIARQFLGFSFVLIALHFYEKKDGTKYMLFLILGFLFHHSVIVWIFLPLLNSLKLTKNKLILITFMWPFILVAGIRLLTFLISHTPYSSYVEVSKSNIRSAGLYIFLFLKLLFYCAYILWSSHKCATREETIIMYSLFIDISMTALVSAHSFLGRAVYLFEPYVSVSFPYILMHRVKVKPVIIQYILFAVAGYIFMSALIEGNDMYGIVPYETIFVKHTLFQ